MKKTTLLDFEINRTKKTNRWLALLTFCMMLFMGQMSFAQIDYTYDWEPTGMGSWTTSGSGSFSRQTVTPCSGNASARANNWYGNESFLVSPALTGTNGGDLTVSFNYKVTNYSNNSTGASAANFGEVRVEWASSTSGPWTVAYTITSADHIVSSSCANKSVTFSGLPSSGDVYVRFVAMSGNSNADNYAYFDDVVITQGPPPTCPAPSALTTLNPTLTSIDLSWDGVGGASGNYEIKWGAVGFDIDAATAIPVTGLTYTLNGTGGNYAFVVREICDTNDESSWSAPYSFSIPNVGDDCSAPIVIATLPYTTTDDTANYTDNPNIEGSPGASGCGITSNYLNGNDVVYAYTAAFEGVIKVSMTPTGTWSGIFAYASCDDIGTACIAGVANSSATERVFELEVTNGDTYYFVISTNPSPQTTEYILNISQVLCAKPTGVAHTDVTHNSAEVSWDILGDYEINWGTGTFVAGDGANTDTVTAATEFLFTGLNGSTTYRYFVRQNCGGTDGDSEWVGPFTFTTLLAPASIPWLEPFTGTTFPTGWANTSTWYVSTSATIVPGAEGSYLYKEIFGTTGTNGAIFSTLRMGLVSAGDILNFNYGLRKYSASYTANGTITIEVSTDNGVTYSPFQTITHSDDVAWTSSGEYDLSAYAGEYIRIRITATRAGSSDDYYLGFDNFYVGQPITCEAPTALTASNITINTADLSWTSEGSAFDISWGAGTFDAEDGTIVAFANGGTLPGLASQTTYQYYVRQDCGADDGVSMWIGPFSFTTDCDSFISLDENFDSYGTGDIVPECWTRLAPATSVGSQTITSTTPASGTRNIYQYAGSTSNPVIVVLPSFSNVNDGTHWLKFKARVSSGAPGALHVGYVTDATDYDSFVLIETLAITNTSYDTDAEYTVIVPTSVPAGAKLAIKNAADAKSYYWDDVIWEETPACLAPTALTVTDITYDSAVLGWTSTGTLFDIEIVEEGETPIGIPTYTGVTNDFETTIPLTPLTSYEFYVRQDCGASGESIWTGPFAFTTECLPPSLTGTTGDTLCGQGEATLSATADAGASIGWYAAQTGGTQLAQGGTFTTPLITETTSYWVSAYTGNSVVVGPVSPTAQGGTTGTQTVAWNVNFTVTEATTLTSIDIFPLTSGQSGTIQLRQGTGSTVITTVPYTTSVSGGATAQTIELNFTLEPGTYNLYAGALPSSGIMRNISGATYPYTSGPVSITGNGYDATYFMGFYNWVFGAGCYSARTEVVATVTTAPTFALSETTFDICEGETSDVVTITTGTSDYDTYVWEPSIGVTGDATNGWTFNPTETTTYTLTASQSAGVCATSVEVTVTVNEAPVLNGITVSTTEICVGGSVELIVNSNTVAPYCLVEFSSDVEPITLVAISNISNVTTATINGTPELEDFTSIVGNLEAGTTYPITVNGNTGGDYTNNFYVYIDWNQNGVFTDPGETYSIGSITNNSGSGTPLIGSIAVPSTALNGNTRMRVLKKFNASTNPGSCNTSGYGQAEDYTLNITGGVDLYTYSWSDGTSVVGTTSSLTLSPTATTTYTVTVTGSNGCTSTESVEITVNPVPQQPVLACYETATFNANTCEWVVTGTQPEQPVLACYETATFNEATCQWDVTGEQPEEPTGLACYEIATFNDVTCQWDVTGEQPEQPALACYETATFNEITCQWDVTGEQPEEPTGLACYEIATFNDVTCQWDVTGEQPEQPVVACYETATFNEVTCEWDVTGTAPAAPTADSPQPMSVGQTVSEIVVTDVTGTLNWYSDEDLTSVVDESTELTEGTHTFWVTQTIDGCESDAIQIVVEVTLSTNVFDNASFRTYPNPVKDFFNVSYSKEITNISVVNMLGQTVLEKAVNATDTQIDMTSLPTGSYFVKVTVEGNSKTVKVIKQ